mmetsp:Transcript_28908/g.47970  ORF Transcript_28908/g.47970 Transcript_28908/m.47970 type:complete len:352 (-) Transcript_28908:518-1573(-)
MSLRRLRDSRIDAMGTLLIEVDTEKDAAKETEWQGEPTRVDELGDDKKPGKRYRSVRVGDEFIAVGDCIYLTPEEKGQGCEIGRVSDMYELSKGQRMVLVQWFWRPEHIELPDEMIVHRKEVFISDTHDENPIEAVERKCNVIQLRDSDAIDAHLDMEPHTFFFRKLYDPALHEFSLEIPTMPQPACSNVSAPAVSKTAPVVKEKEPVSAAKEKGSAQAVKQKEAAPAAKEKEPASSRKERAAKRRKTDDSDELQAQAQAHAEALTPAETPTLAEAPTPAAVAPQAAVVQPAVVTPPNRSSKLSTTNKLDIVMQQLDEHKEKLDATLTRIGSLEDSVRELTTILKKNGQRS